MDLPSATTQFWEAETALITKGDEVGKLIAFLNVYDSMAIVGYSDPRFATKAGVEEVLKEAKAELRRRAYVLAQCRIRLHVLGSDLA